MTTKTSFVRVFSGRYLCVNVSRALAHTEKAALEADLKHLQLRPGEPLLEWLGVRGGSEVFMVCVHEDDRGYSAPTDQQIAMLIWSSILESSIRLAGDSPVVNECWVLEYDGCCLQGA